MRTRVHRWIVAGWSAVCGLAALSTASAQYSYDPSNADEQVPGMRYFGSAKDSQGSLLSGVSFVFDTGPALYVFVTDKQGRYRGNLPLGTVPAKVSAKCLKAGFRSVRLTQRRGSLGSRPTVQVDCVLQAEHAK